MALTCPKCGTQIEQDFGLVNCPGCNSVLAVDVEGNVQIAAANTSDEVQSQTATIPADQPLEAEFQDLDQILGTSAAAAATDLTRGANALEAALEVTGTGGAEAPTGIIDPPKLPATPAQQLNEITEFGNKDTSEGPFSYSLVMENIDLAETREKLKEVISDTRFGWEPNEILQKVRSGRLVLEGLSTAQAVMMVRLLRGSKIQVSWSQHVYS